MISLSYLIYLFILALLLALLEVQIEGKHGWALNLPTWRPHKSRWYTRWYARVMGGKELTGYHLAMFGFVLALLHFPFFVGLSWSWQAELWTISLFFLFDILWDFLWFILNPHYGLHRFKASYISWHKKWTGPLPLDYVSGILLSFVLLLPIALSDTYILFEWVQMVLTWSVLLAVVTLMGIGVKKIRTMD